MTPEDEYKTLVNSIAENIATLADAVNASLGGKLKKKALVVLLANSTKLSQSQITAVLDALSTLKEDWLEDK